MAVPYKQRNLIRDRGGHELRRGDLVMVPLPDYDPERGFKYSFSIGTVIELFPQLVGPHQVKRPGVNGDMVRVHTKWESPRVLSKRVVRLGHTGLVGLPQ
jgi:hypothetical protein